MGEAIPNLSILSIGFFTIKFVERRDFANMSQLIVLELHNFVTDFLPDDLLADLPNLKKIVMKSSRIEKIPEKLLINQKNLKYLSFRGNQIKILEKDSFKYNLKLEEISLELNFFKQIFVDFTKLPALKLLNPGGISCIQGAYLTAVGGEQIETLQNFITNCCGAKTSEAPLTTCRASTNVEGTVLVRTQSNRVVLQSTLAYVTYEESDLDLLQNVSTYLNAKNRDGRTGKTA